MWWLQQEIWINSKNGKVIAFLLPLQRVMGIREHFFHSNNVHNYDSNGKEALP